MILPEYLSTVFLLPKNESKQLKNWPKTFWIITACNPYSSGQRSEDSQNNARLEKDLRASARWIVPITCTSEDGGHDPEPSFAVSDLNHAQIQSLAEKYRQNAVFLIEDTVLTVISCTGEAPSQAGYFIDKVRAEESDA